MPTPATLKFAIALALAIAGSGRLAPFTFAQEAAAESSDPRQAPPKPPTPPDEIAPSPGIVLRVGELPEDALYGGMYRLLFTPDNKTFITRDYGQTIRIWDMATGKLRHELKGHEDYVKALEISPDGNFLISAAADPKEDVRVWDVHTGDLVRKVAGGGKLVQFLPDLTTLVIVSDEKIVNYDMATGGPLAEFPEVRIPLALSPDGKQLAAVRKLDADKLILFDTATGKEMLELPGLTANPAAVRFSPDGKLLAVAGRREELARIWDIAQQKVVLTLNNDDAPEGSKPYVQDIAFSRDGRFVATGSWDHAVRIFEIDGGRLIAKLQGHGDKVVAVEFSPDGRLLASGSAGREDASAVVWDVIASIAATDIAADKIDAQALDTALTQLGLEDPMEAYGAIGTLLADGDKSMAYLEDKIGKELKVAPLDKIEELIGQLDSDDFGTREKATIELTRLRAAADTLLRQKLTETDKPEVRFRIEKILTADAPDSKLTPAAWRQMRRLIYALESLARSDAEAGAPPASS